MINNELITYLLNNGGKKQEETWLQLADKFEVRPELDNVRRAKFCNDIWRNYNKRENKGLESFYANSRIKGVKRWQDKAGSWRQSIAYENSGSGLDLEKAKKDLVTAIAEYELPKFKKVHLNYSKNCAVINLYDCHISSMCLMSETGNYNDTNTGVARFEKAFDELLTTVEAFKPEVIVIPLGHDLFHEDSINNTTRKGTKLDISGNHFDNYTKILMLIRRCLDKASQVARIYCPLITGNHDTSSSTYLFTALEEIFRDNQNIEINADRMTRKYFRYGNSLIGMCHGENIKPDSLPLIMAVERPQDFADCHERIWLTGHFHSAQTKEFPGVTVRTLRALAPTCKWSFDNGYIGAKKQGTAMIFDYNEGLKCEFSSKIV